jgi:hypothetical protein
MSARHSRKLAQLSTHLRRSAMAVALLAASASAASATTMYLEQSYHDSVYTSYVDAPLTMFDKNLGTLTGVHVMFTYLIRIGDPFLEVDRIDDMCSATVYGANVNLSTNWGVSIMDSSPGLPTTNWGCDSGYFDVIEMDGVQIDESLFSLFTSDGFGWLPLAVSFTYDHASVSVQNPAETRQANAGISGGGGRVTYAYTPVPEPATAVMLTMGLAGIAARRYRRRNSAESENQRS